jgi:hypothetical protein
VGIASSAPSTPARFAPTSAATIATTGFTFSAPPRYMIGWITRSWSCWQTRKIASHTSGS